MKRDATGRFTSNWDLEAKKRVSVTLTSTAWRLLDEEARRQGISRSEVIERTARSLATARMHPDPSEVAVRSAQNVSDRRLLDPELPEHQALQPSIDSISPASDFNTPHCPGNQTIEQALRQSEERLRIMNERFHLAARAVDCLIYDWDLRADLVERTDGLTRLLGYSLDQADPTGKWWRDRIHPDDLLQVQSQSAVALQQDDHFSAEYRILNQANQYIDVLDQCLVAARDEAGNPIRIIGSTTDISDRKHAEAERQRAELQLQESQRFIQQIADSMPGTLYVYDMLEQRNVYVNRQIGELLGYTPEQIQVFGDQLFCQLMHPEDFANLGVQFARLHQAQDHEVVDYEYRMRHANGKWRWLWSRNTVSTRTPDGRTHQVVGTVHDVTDRKQAEAALTKSNQTLQAIIQACPLAIMGLRSDGTVQLWNPAAERIFGWSQQEVVGTVLPAIPVNKQEEFFRNLAVATQGQCLVGVETQRQKRGNILFDVELWSAPLNETEAEISCLSVVADITERKQAEAALRESKEQFHALADHIAQLAWMADRQGYIFWYNQRWFDYTGTTLEEMQGWGWQKVHHPEHVERVVAKFRSHIQSGDIWEDTFPLQSKEGQYRWFLSRAIPIRDQQGQVLRWCGTNTDITDRLQAEAEREQLLKREQLAREQAESANRVKDEFLAVLSHELRTPLNPILGWTKLLRSRQFDATTVDRALDTIERNAKLQAQLIEDLLDVSRILQGKLNLNVCPVNLVDTIAASLETVRLSTEVKGIQIQTDLDPTVGLVNGDANRFQQIVWNLLSNAVKFTPSGGQIEVSLTQVKDEAANQRTSAQVNDLSSNYAPIHNYAQIQVKDTGQGISSSFLPHVFEYFRQADSTTTRKFGGLGLGLAIVRHLVELHGGTIWAESPGIGLGATFTVRLPIATVGVTNLVAPALPEQSTDLTGLQILVVDDEPDMRELAKFILLQQGAEVVVAGSAAEAIALFSQCLPDVLLCDIGMPEMNGYDLIRQIRQRSLEAGGMIPAIALTAYARDDDRRQALAAGFQQHIAKPVEPEGLIEAIVQVVKQ